MINIISYFIFSNNIYIGLLEFIVSYILIFLLFTITDGDVKQVAGDLKRILPITKKQILVILTSITILFIEYIHDRSFIYALITFIGLIGTIEPLNSNKNVPFLKKESNGHLLLSIVSIGVIGIINFIMRLLSLLLDSIINYINNDQISFANVFYFIILVFRILLYFFASIIQVICVIFLFSGICYYLIYRIKIIIS